MEGEWSCYRGGHFNERENGHITEGGQFNGGRLIMLQRFGLWKVLMEGEWSCYRGGQFKEGRMVMLQRWPVMEGEWSC